MMFEMQTTEQQNRKSRLKTLIEKKAYLRRDPLKGEEPFELAIAGERVTIYLIANALLKTLKEFRL